MRRARVDGHGRRRWSPRRWAALVAGVVLAAVVPVLVAVPAQAAFPGGNGKIYFTQAREIYSVNPDGSGVTQLTSTGGKAADARVNATSTKVAFLESPTIGNNQVFTMNPDGSNVTQITSATSASTGSLAWSPDGTKLVYSPGGTLTVINADGSNPTSLGVRGASPAWSPDGTKIAYQSLNGTVNTIHPDGTGNTVLAGTASTAALAPNWSPDSTRIVFGTFNERAGLQQIVTMNADGTNQTTISGTNANDGLPVWSPDGTRILFTENTGLSLMNPDGSARTSIYANAAALSNDWGIATVTAPTVTSVSPNNGPKTGGTTVTITGTGFTGATAVTFGTTPATSFTVNSATSITATAPAATAVGPVDVTVTTPAGTSTTNPGDVYTYTYTFTGFFPPVDNPPAVNTRNAGSTVPVKFSLAGNQGLAIFPTGSPASQQYDCTTGAPIGSPQATTGTLNYDPASDRYQYNWTTDPAWAGTCRHLQVTLTDGTTHTANFQFH
ncbi:PxKF domain-containing protein [Amycolatopsis sp. NPDC059021]|uniref:PxKF domain-containing protein n=1 Tax=Amycolatopsis sp. NPDC059021 TaxID=3346704 RepID=UPI00366BC4C2